MACGFQQDHTAAVIDAGYYRVNNASTNVMECPVFIGCNGSATGGDKLCAEGYSGPFCMVCELGDEARYVWSVGECVLCDGGSETTMYAAVFVVGLLFVVAVVTINRGKKNDGADVSTNTRFNTERMEEFYDKFMVKYKIIVTFSQILSKIGTLYPIQLPALFTSFIGNLTFMNFDVSVLPVNCLVDSNFHDRLVATTALPILFVFGITFAWFLLRQRLAWKGGDDLPAALSTLASKAIRLCVIFLFTVFPVVSTTIFQTYQFDDRLKGTSAYLKADYTIQHDDPSQQQFMVYASCMAFVYCLGIPLGSWLVLNRKKESIQKLQIISEILEELENSSTLDELDHDPEKREGATTMQNLRRKSAIHEGLMGGIATTNSGNEKSQAKNHLEKLVEEMQENDPWIVGMSPLYKDYDCTYWWFEVTPPPHPHCPLPPFRRPHLSSSSSLSQIPKFVVTLIMCGLVTLIPAEGASQVFISFVVSMGMMLLFANCQPYLNTTDDVLAQVASPTFPRQHQHFRSCLFP
jgi:hypothetical protein